MSQPTRLPSQNAFISAGAYSLHFMDAFAFRSNPACLGSVKWFSCGLLGERKWMLKELDNYTLCASFFLGRGGWGISMQHSGDRDYSEQGLELAYGKNLGRLECGISFGYLQNLAAGYSAAGFGTAGIGIRFHVSEKLISGWELKMPVFGSRGKTNPEKSAWLFSMGLGYELRPELLLALQIIKSSGLPVNIMATLDYRFAEQFFFSFGLNSDLGSPYFKTGWKKNRISIQLYAVYEPVLGFSPGLVLLWATKNNKG